MPANIFFLTTDFGGILTIVPFLVSWETGCLLSLKMDFSLVPSRDACVLR